MAAEIIGDKEARLAKERKKNTSKQDRKSAL